MTVSKDKYLIVSLICSLILISFSFFDCFDMNNDNVKIGIVSEVRETGNGFVFQFIDDSNITYSCFWKEKPEVHSIYEIKASFSDSKSMIFIDSIKKCQTS